jgi:hypothetical protein
MVVVRVCGSNLSGTPMPSTASRLRLGGSRGRACQRYADLIRPGPYQDRATSVLRIELPDQPGLVADTMGGSPPATCCGSAPGEPYISSISRSLPAAAGDSLNVRSPEQVAWGRRYGDAVDVERAADLYAQGWTLRQIGAELGITWTVVGHQFRQAHQLRESRRPTDRYDDYGATRNGPDGCSASATSILLTSYPVTSASMRLTSWPAN